MQAIDVIAITSLCSYVFVHFSLVIFVFDVDTELEKPYLNNWFLKVFAVFIPWAPFASIMAKLVTKYIKES